MSYASSKLNTENHFDLSARYLKRTGKNLNESLDFKEILLPERRRANIREANAVLRGLPTSTLLDEIRLSYEEINLYVRGRAKYFRLSYQIVKNVLVEVMQNVLQNDFIDVWEQMNLYNCVTGSLDLYKIIRNSFDANVTETWQSAISLRLEEKMIASNRTLHNLDRVHDAYNNAVPLVNNNVTAEGRYDFLYITSELFPQTSEINETYIHLRGHLQKYIQNIDALVRMYNANGHRRQACTECFNYSAGFREASVEYERGLRKYESLVVRKPLKRFLAERKHFSDERNIVVIILQSSSKLSTLRRMVNKASDQYVEFNKTHISDKISEYLDNVKTKRFGSKLDLAGELMSDRFTMQLENFINFVSRIEDYVSRLKFDAGYHFMLKCFMISNVSSRRLFRSFVAQLYNYYKNTTGPEKANIYKEYFLQQSDQIMMKLARGEHILEICLTNPDDAELPFSNITRLIKDLSLRNLRSYKKKLESFLETSRLDGKFSRYVLPYQTKTDSFRTKMDAMIKTCYM